MNSLLHSHSSSFGHVAWEGCVEVVVIYYDSHNAMTKYTERAGHATSSIMGFCLAVSVNNTYPDS